MKEGAHRVVRFHDGKRIPAGHSRQTSGRPSDRKSDVDKKIKNSGEGLSGRAQDIDADVYGA